MLMNENIQCSILYLSSQGRFRHLLDGDVEQIIQERDRKWAAIRKSWRIEARELSER